MKRGDLIFVRGDSWIDHEIESISHSPYSHCAGFIGNNELVEAQGFRRTGFQSPSVYKGESDIFTCDTLTDEQRAEIVKYVTAQVGGFYDYLLIGWEALRYIFHWMIPFAEPFHSRICSTLWSDAYRKVGVDLCPGIKLPTPGDLASSKLLRKIGSY